MNAQVVDVQENIAVLHSIIDGIPDHLIRLERFKQKTECGTICCGVGWAAMHPYFQKQGLTLEGNTPVICGRYANTRRSYDRLFGEDAFTTMFAQRGTGLWDAELLRPGMTDKQLLLARLKKGYKEYAPAHND